MNIKAYVYDTSKGFCSFIKHYYSEKMEIDVCTNKKNFFLDDIKDYEVSFFIVNDMEDFFNMKKVYFKIEHFFIGSPNRIIYEKIQDLKYDVIYIDLNNHKNDIINQINSNLASKKIM